MSVHKAKKHFTGRAGRRLHCGQAILEAFKEKFPVPEEIVRQFHGYGAGKAPEGHCGAFYAARVLLEKHFPEKLAHFEKTFSELAGSTKCKEIRNARRLSCLECVEKAGEYLERLK